MTDGPPSPESGSETDSSANEQVLAVGDEVPAVGAPLVRPDGSVDDVSLSALVAETPALLCFYTMDFSPDCVKQWCTFRDFEWFDSNPHVQVVGVSKSGPRIHRRFVDRYDLSFSMYSDRDLALSRAFGVDYRTLGLFRRSRRSCFLVDEDRIVRYRWLSEHWLDPTRDVPPVGEIHEAVVSELGIDVERFGF